MTERIRPIRAWGGVVMLLLALAYSAAVMRADEGAEYAGQDACLQCHQEVKGVAFERTAHGRASATAPGGASGCEACHGPGKAHADSAGATKFAASPSASCLACHQASAGRGWEGSAHEQADLDCASCHQVHAPWSRSAALANTDRTEACLTCHTDMRKHLFQRSSHPLREGLMSCASCHDPHGSSAQAAIAASTPNEKCYQCHAEKRGPFLFEHQPVREDCKTCHDPHGSNQRMMLTTTAPRLCQSCHLFGHHQTVPGESTQMWNQNRSCLNCHPRVHGTNHPSGAILMR